MEEKEAKEDMEKAGFAHGSVKIGLRREDALCHVK